MPYCRHKRENDLAIVPSAAVLLPRCILDGTLGHLGSEFGFEPNVPEAAARNVSYISSYKP